MASLMPTLVVANILIYILTSLTMNSAVQLKLTNLQCETLEPSILTYRFCRLKMIRRGVAAVNLHVELHQKVESIVINACHFKKVSGYKPFLFNTTFNFCEYKKKLPTVVLAKVFMNFISEYSNLNHSCPYEHDIILKDMVLTENKFQIIPLPTGDYMEKLSVYMNDKLVTIIKGFYYRIE